MRINDPIIARERGTATWDVDDRIGVAQGVATLATDRETADFGLSKSERGGSRG